MTFLSENGTLDKPFCKAQKGFVKNFVGKKTLRIVSSLVALSLLSSLR